MPDLFWLPTWPSPNWSHKADSAVVDFICFPNAIITVIVSTRYVSFKRHCNGEKELNLPHFRSS